MYIGSWKIDDSLTFYVNTQVFSTGVATDADAVPAYRLYEDETGTPILTGNMALLDSANTAGFYSEQISLSAANGFEKGKCYSIYISATVSTVAGATHKTFQIEAETAANSLGTQAKADVNAEVLDVLNVDTFAQPGQATPAATTSMRLMLAYIYKTWRNRITQTSAQLSIYNDDAATVDQKATYSNNGTTADRGEISTGP